MEGTFREWLADRLGGEGKVSRRELARRLAEGNPSEEESHRRSIRRILAGSRSPSQRTRDAIQDALNDHSAPREEDEGGLTERERLEFRRLALKVAREVRA